MDTELFIEKAKKVHGEKYDYSKVNYVDAKTKVTIICPKHGEFEVTPNAHLNGNGCKECAKELTKEKVGISKEEFIRRATEKFGDRFDYSNIDYRGFREKTMLYCRQHGAFEASPFNHLRRDSGCCPGCKKEAKALTTEQFIAKSKEKYGDRFSYEHTVYKSNEEPIIITCPVHGDVETTPHEHFFGNGCRLCGLDSKKLSQEEVIRRFREAHGDKFDYSKTVYVNASTPLTYICPKHGEITQYFQNHIEYGCPECNKERRKQEGLQVFLTKAKEKFGDKFDYSKVEYVDVDTPVLIRCPKHGWFEQTPYQHLKSVYGCEACYDDNRGYLMSTMQKKSEMNQDELNAHFINMARKIHGDKYDYGKSVFKTWREDVIITCSEHGDFHQKAGDHLRGLGCPTCAMMTLQENQRLFRERYIERVREKFGDRFDLSECDYKGLQYPVTIFDNDTQKTYTIPNAANLANGVLPKVLSDTYAYDVEDFKIKSEKIHKGKYSYALVTDFEKQSDFVDIICPRHGIFKRNIHQHLIGKGCPVCERGREDDPIIIDFQKLDTENLPEAHDFLSTAITKEEFLKRAKEKFGEKYDYSKINYVNYTTPISVVCPEHGEFTVTPVKHVNSMFGCQKCANIAQGLKSRYIPSDYIRRANEIHNNKYDYSLADFSGLSSDRIAIICPEEGHGVFYQSAASHLQGHGCPICGAAMKKSENKVFEALKEKYGNVIRGERSLECLKGKTSPLELDCYLPDLRVAVEYQGIAHFYPNDFFGGEVSHLLQVERDKRKFEVCKEAGIRIFYISFEKNVPEDYIDTVHRTLESLFEAIDNHIANKQVLE